MPRSRRGVGLATRMARVEAKIRQGSWRNNGCLVSGKSMTDHDLQVFVAQVSGLAKVYRARCLWFDREDFVPQTIEEAQRVLACIERYGDRAGFEEVQRLRQWLSQHSNTTSAG